MRPQGAHARVRLCTLWSLPDARARLPGDRAATGRRAHTGAGRTVQAGGSATAAVGCQRRPDSVNPTGRNPTLCAPRAARRLLAGRGGAGAGRAERRGAARGQEGRRRQGRRARQGRQGQALRRGPGERGRARHDAHRGGHPGHEGGLHRGAPAGALLVLPRVHLRRDAVRRRASGPPAGPLDRRRRSRCFRCRWRAANITAQKRWQSCALAGAARLVSVPFVFARRCLPPTVPVPRRPRRGARGRGRRRARAAWPDGAGACASRYYHPAPPARAIVKAERTFEGISLDTPGTSGRQVAAMSRFQLCPACFEAEAGCALRRRPRRRLSQIHPGGSLLRPLHHARRSEEEEPKSTSAQTRSPSAVRRRRRACPGRARPSPARRQLTGRRGARAARRRPAGAGAACRRASSWATCCRPRWRPYRARTTRATRGCCASSSTRARCRCPPRPSRLHLRRGRS